MPGAYKYLWDKVNSVWRKGLGDEEGRVIISSESPIPVGRIPDGAAEIAVSAYTSGQLIILHTTPAGKIFYLTTAVVTTRFVLGGGPANLSYRNEVGAVQANLVWMYSSATGVPHTVAISFNPPLSVFAGWDVFIYSSDENIGLHGFIHGYEM